MLDLFCRKDSADMAIIFFRTLVLFGPECWPAGEAVMAVFQWTLSADIRVDLRSIHAQSCIISDRLRPSSINASVVTYFCVPSVVISGSCIISSQQRQLLNTDQRRGVGWRSQQTARPAEWETRSTWPTRSKAMAQRQDLEARRLSPVRQQGFLKPTGTYLAFISSRL